MKHRAEAAYFDAFVTLMKEKSFEEITTSEIIMNSGYSRSGFYKLFYDKYALAEALLTSLADSYANIHMESILELQGTPDFLYHYSMKILSFAEKKKDIFRLIFSAAIPGIDEEAFCKKTIEAFHRIGSFNLIPGKESISEDFFYYASTHQYLIYLRYWNSIDYQGSADEIARQIHFFQNHLEPFEILSVN